MEKVTLFGSKARKDDDPESDIDLSAGGIDACLLAQRIFVLCLKSRRGENPIGKCSGSAQTEIPLTAQS